jgi:transposase
MKITPEEFKRIESLLPVQRGNVKHDNLKFLNAVLYVAENGCKWRGLPKEYGNWNSIYKKANRWSKQGVLERVFIALQKEQVIKIKIEHLSLDSTSIKLHPDAHGALQKRVCKPSGSQEEVGTQSFMWLPRMIRLQ